MSSIKTLKTFIGINFKISKTYIPLMIINSLIETAVILLNVYFPKLIIDELLGTRDINKLTILVIIIIFSNLVGNFLAKLLQKALTLKRTKNNERFFEELSKKIMRLEYEKIEDPYVLDLKERAVFAATNQGAIDNLILNMMNILKAIFTLIGVIAIILTLNVYLILILLLLVLLTMLCTVGFKNYQTKFFQRLIPINRQYHYYGTLVDDNTITKDVRIYNLGKMFSHKLHNFNLKINQELVTMSKFQGFYFGITNLISNLQLALVYLYMGYLYIYKNLTIGALTLYVSASQRFATSLNDLIISLAMIKQMIYYLQPFMEFMDLDEPNEETSSTTLLKEIKTIEFINVSFNYPRSDVKVLDNISFKINKGEKISIVGLNGAGKTTLIKLLCRLYQPTSGEILINGINIFDYEYSSYLGQISAIFQDYKIFAFTVKENIILSEEEDVDRINEVLEKNNLHDVIEKLPKGINTNLYKIFDEKGIELSGGQYQKIAIARALYKKSDLVILDEPTSALDPIAEYEVYNSFNHLIENKTAIYISHRMSSSIFCDKILVIEGGKVAAFASHQELLQDQNSLYYQLFTTQAKNYALPKEALSK